jgi:hypothetical protein
LPGLRGGAGGEGDGCIRRLITLSHAPAET